MSVLTGAAVLLLVLALHVAGLGYLLAVGDLRLLQPDRHAEARLELGGKHGEVHIAHAVDQHLLGLGVVLVPQGEVFLQHLGDCLRNLALVLGGLGHDGAAHIRRGVGHAGVGDVAGGAQGVAGVGVGQLGDHAEIAAGKLVHLGLLLTLHNIHMRHFLTDAGAQVAQGHIAVDCARHDLEEGHLADERVGDGLVHEQCGIALGGDRHVPAVLVLFKLAGSRTREGSGDGVQHGDDAPQVDSRAAVHRHDGALNDAVVQSLDRLLQRKGLALKELFHQLVGGAGKRLVQRVLELGGGVLPADAHGGLGPVALLVVLDGTHGEQVDHGDVLAGLHRDEHRADRNAEGGVQLAEHALELALLVIALVDEEGAGDACLAGNVPCKLGADLNARLAVHADDGGVRHADSLPDLTGEIQEAGCVEDIDPGVLPCHERRRCGEREAARTRFGIIVAGRVALRGIAETIDGAGHVQHRLGDGSLSAAAVTEKSQVPDLFGIEFSHSDSPSSAADGGRDAQSAVRRGGHLSVYS